MKTYVDAEKLQEYTTKLVAKLKTIFTGTPQPAATVADMTDHDKLYVYTGSETGYTAGNLYYWDGTAWTSGGVYNSAVIATDTTLSVSGKAADGKATGDAIAAAKAAVLAEIAPAYSTSGTYAVGDYVIYNSGLYRCVSAISTAESWTAAHWVSVDLAPDLGGQVSALKTQLIDETKTGNIVKFSDGSNNIPYTLFVVDLDYNANGYTKINIVSHNGNLFPYVLPQNTIHAVFSSQNNGEVRNANNARVFGIPCRPNTNYIFSRDSESSVGFAIGLTDNMVAVGDHVQYVGALSTLSTISFNSGDHDYIVFSLENEAKFNDNDSVYKARLNIGTEDNGYKRGIVYVYDVDMSDLGGVVYGGTIDLIVGSVTSKYDSNGNELISPEVYTITPVQVKTLYGDNVLYADYGALTVSYLANIELYIRTYGSLTPESFGAIGDGVHDDTTAMQSALNSGMQIIAPNKYLVSTVNIINNNLKIIGEIKGQIVINNNATVEGGTIRQTTDDPCVIFESSNLGYLNSTLRDCNIIPTTTGIGIKLITESNNLFGVKINNIDITNCEKSIWIYNSENHWITKCDVENVFCHTSNYVIFVDNLNGFNTSCAEFTFRNVYSQFLNADNKPTSFFKLNQGNAIMSLYDSFCYDGIGAYHYDLTGSTGTTRLFLIGRLYNSPTDAKFTNSTDIRDFYIIGESYANPLYLKGHTKTELPKDYNGCAYIENISSPALSGSRFFGLIGRGGQVGGYGAPNHVFGISCYEGRLSILKSTDGTITNGSVYEVSTPYSGNVYTTATLPTTVRNGAKCWCSDIKMDVTYFDGTWYKPDGTAVT